MGGALTPVSPQPAPGKVEALRADDLVTIQSSVMEEGLRRARENGKEAGIKETRAAAKREREAALAAQAEAHVAELERALGAQRETLEAEWHASMIHRVRAARLWSGLACTAVSFVIAAIAGLSLARGTLSAGSDIAMDAAMKSRVIEHTMQRSEDLDVLPPQTGTNGYATGDRAPNGATMHTREPADAPRERQR